ncbi:uncharacterized protein EI97DRAFT_459392 [Westerdykella ornata]|uniref:C3H1-type domain-containing protein n=1 Tax=Westerdykella ornata TaxID=318751 RepID=A0A6A6JG20_WESOR|nr:uncharacterized protein EI97DRAFT_459392 [Westerdykella ornata]KAF2275491.1 hypothetical protein EI97DRAFT_459392 [Westerdykella ornata]
MPVVGTSYMNSTETADLGEMHEASKKLGLPGPPEDDNDKFTIIFDDPDDTDGKAKADDKLDTMGSVDDDTNCSERISGGRSREAYESESAIVFENPSDKTEELDFDYETDHGDKIIIEFGFQDTSKTIFNGWSIPTGFPLEETMKTNPHFQLNRAELTTMEINGYLEKYTMDKIMGDMRSLKRRDHQIVLRNLHLETIIRIMNRIDEREEKRNEDDQKIFALQDLLWRLLKVHPTAAWHDSSEILREKRKGVRAFCKYVNSATGCPKGFHCSFSHAHEGLACYNDMHGQK